MRRTTLALGVLLLATSAASADIPGPDGKRGPDRRFIPPPLPPQLIIEGQPLIVSDDSSDGRVHVRIPRKLLPAPQGQPAPAASTSTSGPASRTIIAGVCLSAAMVTGGFWLLRHRRVPRHFGKLAVAASFLAASLGCGLLDSWLNRTPPLEPIAGALSSGRVEIQYVDEGDAITIRLPKEMAAKVRDDTSK